MTSPRSSFALAATALALAGCAEVTGSAEPAEDSGAAYPACAFAVQEGVQEVGPGPWTVDASALGAAFGGGEVEILALQLAELTPEEARETLETCALGQSDVEGMAACDPPIAPASEPRTCAGAAGAEGQTWAVSAVGDGEASAVAIFRVLSGSTGDTLVLSP